MIDTSVAVGIPRWMPKRLPQEMAISTLTLAELTAGPHAAADELDASAAPEHLQRFETKVEALPFEPGCARAYGSIYAAVLAGGRKPRGARAVDLMIAATALAHDLPLYTRNAKDLRGLEELIEIVDVERLTRRARLAAARSHSARIAAC